MGATPLSSSFSTTSLSNLFTGIEAQYMATALGPDHWYLIPLGVFTSSGKCHLTAALYTYLIMQPQHSTCESRQTLVRRLREALLKLTSIIGVARPLEAIIHLDRVIAPADRDYTFSRQDWKNDDSSHERGEAWLKKCYGENLDPIYDMFDSHRDFGWISSEITYGLYLSDHRILSGVETEIVVLSGMWTLGLPRMFGWHLRASRRIGIGYAECEILQQCVSHVCAA